MIIFKFSGSLFFILLLIPQQVFTQDILYKKDSTVLEINIIDASGKTIKYEIPGDSPGKTYSLSKFMLDSIRYSKGELLDLTSELRISEPSIKQLNRNYINLQMTGLIEGNLNVDYERISKTGKSGIVSGLFININPNGNYVYWTDDHIALEYATFDPYYFFVSVGVNFYPLNNSLVRTSNLRFSTGLSGLVGSYRKIDDYYYPDGYRYVPVFASGIMWNITLGIYLGKHFQITGGVETSLLPFLTFLCPQLSLSYGF